MTRHTTFRYCLDPTAEQQSAFARHAGAARFAFNQCLGLHLRARKNHRCDGSVVVPWTGFDFINVFNAWKKTAQAGRVIAVSSDGDAEVVATGGPVTNAHRQERSGHRPSDGETSLNDVGTDAQTAPAA